MPKILITGCAGFLAHNLILEAKRGKWEVIGIDKRLVPEGHSKPDKFLKNDIFDLNYMDLMDIDAVVHLAWRTNIADCLNHPEKSTKDNVNMTLHLLQVCKEAGIKKFIFPSTASLYSNNKTPWTEDMVVEPIEFYSWQKLACESLCQMYARQFNLPTVIFRFFQVYGEFQRKDTVISKFSRLKEEGKPLTLFKPKAEAKIARDFIYTGDLAKAIMLAIKSKNVGNGEILNICTKHLNTIEEIAKAFKHKIEWIKGRDYDVDIHLGDNRKARMLLGWKPETDVLTWLNKNV